MNRRILLAWELGRGRGHAYIAGWVARALRRRGYEPIAAIKQLDSADVIAAIDPDTACIQAPIWPDLLAGSPILPSDPPVTLGDTMGQVGLRSSASVRQVLRAWDQLFKEIEPAAVVADFAPGALLAARGRLPSIAIGDCTTLPPATMKNFPLLSDRAVGSKYEESQLIDAVNGALRETSRATLAYLPEVFAADRSCVAAFSELDPYREHRDHPNAAPWLPAWDHGATRSGDEIFAYISMRPRFEATIVRALQSIVKQGIPVRVHMPAHDAEALALLEELGVMVERAALPFEDIQRRSRLVLSVGSLGFVSCALVAGIPQIVLPLGDFTYVASAIEQLGAGRSIKLQAGNPLEVPLLAQAIVDIYRDENILARAQEIAPSFSRRLAPPPEEAVARYVEDLIGSA